MDPGGIRRFVTQGLHVSGRKRERRAAGRSPPVVSAFINLASPPVFFVRGCGREERQGRERDRHGGCTNKKSSHDLVLLNWFRESTFFRRGRARSAGRRQPWGSG